MNADSKIVKTRGNGTISDWIFLLIFAGWNILGIGGMISRIVYQGHLLGSMASGFSFFPFFVNLFGADNFILAMDKDGFLIALIFLFPPFIGLIIMLFYNIFLRIKDKKPVLNFKIFPSGWTALLHLMGWLGIIASIAMVIVIGIMIPTNASYINEAYNEETFQGEYEAYKINVKYNAVSTLAGEYSSKQLTMGDSNSTEDDRKNVVISIRVFNPIEQDKPKINFFRRIEPLIVKKNQDALIPIRIIYRDMQGINRSVNEWTMNFKANYDMVSFYDGLKMGQKNEVSKKYTKDLYNPKDLYIPDDVSSQLPNDYVYLVVPDYFTGKTAKDIPIEFTMTIKNGKKKYTQFKFTDTIVGENK